jgi:hypothetical protein
MTVLTFTVFSLAEAQPRMKFENNHHDFGKIGESDGKVRHVFTFTNEGDAPLIIQGVRSSCDCTAPHYSREPIAPGKSGSVTAEYNPENRSGRFNSTVTITTNGQPSVSFVRISGEVIEGKGGAGAINESMYRNGWGNLRSIVPHVYIGDVMDNSEHTFEVLSVYNQSDKPIKITDANTPDYILIRPMPMIIEPKKKAEIYINYDASKTGRIGQVFDRVTLITDDTDVPRKSFNVAANVIQYFDKSNVDEGPVIRFTSTSHDFGKIKAGEQVETKFEFKNIGKDKLRINRVMASCGCTAGMPEKTELEPGESSVIKVKFNSEGRSGPDHKAVDVYSNDPNTPVTRLTIRSNIN